MRIWIPVLVGFVAGAISLALPSPYNHYFMWFIMGALVSQLVWFIGYRRRIQKLIEERILDRR